MRNKLKEKREKLAAKATEIMKAAEAANNGKGRALTDEERTEFDAAIADVETLSMKMECSQAMDSLNQSLNRSRPSYGTIGTSEEVAPAPSFRDAAGNEIRVLSRRHSLADRLIEVESDLEQFRGQHLLGRMIRERITGRADDVCEEYRSSSLGSNPSAGILSDNFLSSELIDLARSQSTVIQAGARTIEMPGETLTFARLTADPALEWKAENAAFTERDPNFDSIMFVARTCGTVVHGSRELAEDAPNWPAVVSASMAAAVASEIDRISLVGSGSAEPTGLLTHADNPLNVTAGIGSVVHADLLTARKEILESNFPAPTHVILSPRDDAVLLSLTEATTNAPLAAPVPIDRDHMNFMVTSQVPTDLGAGSDSVIFLGGFENLWIGLRSGINIEVTTEGDDTFSKHQVGIKISWRGDINFSHLGAFARLDGTT